MLVTRPHTTGNEMLKIIVYGEPVPQGSKTAGKMKNGNPYVRDANARALKTWRKNVHGECVAAMRNAGIATLDGPIVVHAKYFFPHTQKSKEGMVKITAPDLDKINRSTGDALESSKLIVNDARIVGWPATPAKFYSDTPRAEIVVGTLDEFFDKITRGDDSGQK